MVQALQVQEREEVEWGEVLHVVHSGLVASRRLLWDESERKVIALLSSSSAFEGDHFLQVWLDRRQPCCRANRDMWTVHAVSSSDRSAAGDVRVATSRLSDMSFEKLHS